MKFTAISLLIFFFLPLVGAINFTLSSPDKAYLNDNITVSLDASTSETYDVKIYLTNGALENLSKIYNSGWKSTFYYLPAAFPVQKNFLLNIIRVDGNASLCAKLRTIDKKSISESCNRIELAYPENIEEQEESNEENLEENLNNTLSNENEEEVLQEEDSTEIPKQEEKEDEEIEELSLETEKSSQKKTNSKINGKIILNSDKSLENNNHSVLLSKEEKLRMGLIYFFSALCIVLIILIYHGKI